MLMHMGKVKYTKEFFKNKSIYHELRCMFSSKLVETAACR